MLKQFYVTRPNAYLDGLKLYANCNDINSNKTNSLSYTGRITLFAIEY